MIPQRQRVYPRRYEPHPIPVSARYNEDEDEEYDDVPARHHYAPQSEAPPHGFYARWKVWTLIGIVVWIYFRFSGG